MATTWSPNFAPLTQHVRERGDGVVVDLVQEQVDRSVCSSAPLNGGPELGEVDRPKEIRAIRSQGGLREIQEKQAMPEQPVERNRMVPLAESDPQ